MARQSKAQREYMRNIRTHNSINYLARSTKPRCLQNIDIIMKTMKYNELDDELTSPEVKKVKLINTGLLIFTVLFEVMVLVVKTMAFMLTIGSKRRRSW
jgi:hypothetical protein